MTRRLIQPKMKKKRPAKKKEKGGKKIRKEKRDKKKGLPPLKKMLNYTSSISNYKRRSLSSVRNKRRSERLIKKNIRISKSRPPNKVLMRKRHRNLGWSKNANGFDKHNYVGKKPKPRPKNN